MYYQQPTRFRKTVISFNSSVLKMFSMIIGLQVLVRIWASISSEGWELHFQLTGQRENVPKTSSPAALPPVLRKRLRAEQVLVPKRTCTSGVRYGSGVHCQISMHRFTAIMTASSDQHWWKGNDKMGPYLQPALLFSVDFSLCCFSRPNERSPYWVQNFLSPRKRYNICAKDKEEKRRRARLK